MSNIWHDISPKRITPEDSDSNPHPCRANDVMRIWEQAKALATRIVATEKKCDNLNRPKQTDQPTKYCRESTKRSKKNVAKYCRFKK